MKRSVMIISAVLLLLSVCLLLCACHEHNAADGIPEELVTFLISMVPVIELRGAIPYATAAGLSPWVAYILSVLGNMLPVPFILLFIRKILDWMKRYPRLLPIATWVETRAAGKGARVKRSQLIGLFVFVAIPLPGTGAWTGTLAASILDMKFMDVLFACMGGVLLAGVIMGVLSVLGVGIFTAAKA